MTKAKLLRWMLIAGMTSVPAVRLLGQTAAMSLTQADPAEMTSLLERLAAAEARLDASERETQALRSDLRQMRAELLSAHPSAPSAPAEAAVVSAQEAPPPSGISTSAADQSTLQASQIATLDQSKVETASRYPLRLTGTLLLSGFTNTGRVDQAASPTAALGGPGSTAISMQQTVLGLDADGPHLAGAQSHADVRFDFFGASGVQTYNGAGGMARLRTAHIALNWKHTEVFFSLDHPLLSPNQPGSLLAAAQPELAWSGNLWSWNPQAGVTQTWGTRTRFRVQAAAIDPADPALGTTSASGMTPKPSLSEQSRRPGLEGRVALLCGSEEGSSELGLGGYFSRHAAPDDLTGSQQGFDSWAATVDYRFHLRHGFVLSGSAYRGQALGGLGGGGYKDFVYRSVGSGLAVRPLEDVGGWVQVHQNAISRLEWNAGLGVDNAFSSMVRNDPFNTPANLYGSIARNRTIYANVIYSPSAWLLFSVEYRNLYTAPAPGPVWISNSTGLGAAYRF